MDGKDSIVDMMSSLAKLPLPDHLSLHRSQSMETYTVHVFLGSLCSNQECVSVESVKSMQSEDVVRSAVSKADLGDSSQYQLAETFSSGGQVCKERRLENSENPVRIQLLWPRVSSHISDIHRTFYQFFLRPKEADRPSGTWLEYTEKSPVDNFLTSFLHQPKDKEYPDLCNLPDLNEKTLLDNLKKRFDHGNIYTYVGSILISVNPFKFYPIYNPKYVKLYQNCQPRELPPHIFAIADAAYSTMLQQKRNQCIVISGESGSGKTESTNLLLHHLSALSQGTKHCGIEQTILGAGPVLEAFGNARTVHNNNSSRFGKFIQVNYKENGMVHGAVVEKYLLEKSRIVSQAKDERNYHVFYYMLAGCSAEEKESLGLGEPENFVYLNQSVCDSWDTADGEFMEEVDEFQRLRQSMEIVGFSSDIQRRIFSVLAAVLHVGNIKFRRKTDQSHHEAVAILDLQVVRQVSSLLKVKEETLIEALTKKKTMAGGETVVISYKLADAIATRDALAKCLYGALFDWIVLQVNHALLHKRDNRDHQGNSIGVLDIFGFEDFDNNSFEQFCINYANEHLQYYFNQHIFKFEQEEYLREGIQWKNIEFIDNTGCLNLFSHRPTGLLCLLDEECSFPGATNETLLVKFNSSRNHHRLYYDTPQMRESAFIVEHYAGSVKYSIEDFREKNSDLMRHDIVLVLKNSTLAFVRELVGYDPVAMMRWAIVRAFFRAYFAFIDAGRRQRKSGLKKYGSSVSSPKLPTKTPPLLKGQSDDLTNLTSDSNCDDSPNTSVVVCLENDKAEQHIKRVNGKPEIVKPEITKPEIAKPEIAKPSCMINSHPSLMRRKHAPLSSHHGHRAGFYNQSPVMERANQLINHRMRNKSFRPKRTTTVKPIRDLKALKTLSTGKTQLGPRKSKSKMPSVGAQFNLSLHRLMETLNQANPFFVRCIKSNMEKAPCKYDENMVLRQLRYTGMLATVKIRQSGYNYRLTFDEFIHQYKVLLPKGLVSSRDDIQSFLNCLDVNSENYQIGKTKVFLREAEKMLLDHNLHQTIIRSIVHIQRWLKTKLERKRFVKIRAAAVTIQSHFRSFLAQRHAHYMRIQLYACMILQKAFRDFKKRKRIRQQVDAVTLIQTNFRRWSAMKRYTLLQQEKIECEKKLIVSGKPSDVTPGRELGKIPCEKDVDNTDGESYHVVKKSGDVEKETPANYSKTEDESLAKNAITEQKSQQERNKKIQLEKKPQLDVSDSQLLNQHSVRRVGRTSQSSSTTALPQATTHHRDSSKASHELFPLVGPGYGGLQIDSTLRSRSHHKSRLPEKSHSIAALPRPVKTQQGPRDIEIHIKPAIAKSMSDEYISSSYKSSSAALGDKRIIAPLAKKESFSDNSRGEPVIVRRLTLSHDGIGKSNESAANRYKDTLEDPHSPSSSPSASSSHKSPFQRVKKNLRNIMGGDVRHTEEKHTTTRSMKYTSMCPSTPSNTLTMERALSLPSSKAKQQVTEEKMSHKAKKSSGGTAFIRHPQKSLRQLLHQSKKYQKKDDGIDSDDSQTEDQGPVSSPSPQPISKKIMAKSKDAWISEVPDTDRKPRYRRRGSKKKRAADRRERQLNMANNQQEEPPAVNSWNVARTSEWKYPAVMLVTSATQLRQFDNFVYTKIVFLSKDCGQRDTIFDKVFKNALKELHNNLITEVSIAMQDNQVAYSYKDLMCRFEDTLRACAKKQGEEDSFPATIGINAFRGFLDEFAKKKESRDLPEVKLRKEKKKKEKDKGFAFEHCGHHFTLNQFNIPTYCEFCSSSIWIMERGYVCQVCKYTLHKKCSVKSSVKCKGSSTSAVITSHSSSSSSVFGKPLDRLVKHGHRVPIVVDRLISAIEKQGLYTEGLYRKAGAKAKTRQLIQRISSENIDDVDFMEYHVHVLTSVVKEFLRELPDPLLTFGLYDEFIRASDIEDEKERVQAVFAALDKLPQLSHDLMERIVFHLSKVAQNKGSNLMSVDNLAIIFAPTMLKSRKSLPAQLSLQHVAKQSRCLQCIIDEQLSKLTNTLEDIKTLDTATSAVEERLCAVRASMRTQQKIQTHSWSEVQLTQEEPLMEQTIPEADHGIEEQYLSRQIETLRKEREALTVRLPMLECRMSSSEEDLLCTDDLESIADDLDSIDHDDEYPTTFEDTASSPKPLQHLNKHRAPTPLRRPPSRRIEENTVSTRDADDDVPHIPDLTLPELQQVGDEILV